MKTLRNLGPVLVLLPLITSPPALHSQQSGFGPLPTEYGMYIVDNGRLSDLTFINTVIRKGIAVGNVVRMGTYVIDGIAETYYAGQSKITHGFPEISPGAYFILHHYDSSPTKLNLAKLAYVESMRAYEFNLAGTSEFAFANIYRKRYNESVPIRAWRPVEYISLGITPVPQRQGMFILRPSVLLRPGTYALFFNGQIHDDVFVVNSLETNNFAFPFDVVIGRKK